MKDEGNSKISLTIKSLVQNNNDNSQKINNKDLISNGNNLNEKSDDGFANIEINSIKSQHSYRSMFSIMSKSDYSEELNDSDKIQNFDRKNTYKSNMSLPSDSIKNMSFWQAIKLKLSNIKNQIIFNYNIFSAPYNLEYSSSKLEKEIQIFDTKYTDHEKLLNQLKNIPWFSYRKDFDQIVDEDNIYTSDAGWGCMIRASQMILAQGLCKLSSINNLNDFINQYISYFYDNKIPIKFMVKNNNNLKNQSIKIKIKHNIFEDFEVLDLCKFKF